MIANGYWTVFKPATFGLVKTNILNQVDVFASHETFVSNTGHSVLVDLQF